MEILYLVIIIFGVSGQSILKKMYSEKTGGKGLYTYSLMIVLAALLFFIITSGNLEWNVKLLPYSILFAVFFSMAMVLGTLAISCGPLSLTSLITSFSLMIPTFYGLLFLKEPVSFGLIPGLILLSICLVLINKKGKEVPVNFKWLIYVTLAFVGNGMCSVMQKIQQNAFNGKYKNEFMIISLIIVSLIIFAVSFAKERKEYKYYVKKGITGAFFNGILNGAVNLFVMILSGIMSVSVMFPLISVGGIVVTFIVSKVFYKEKLTKAQHLGFVFGVAAIVFLNI